jgi:apolipoprotein N-acyltransferase
MSGIASIKDRLSSLSKWHKRGVLFSLGLIAATALPPLHLVFFITPGLVAAFWETGRATTRKQAFAVGWWLGFGYFCAGFYWISHSFFVDAATHGWMAPFAIGGLAAAMAVFIGLTTLLCWLIEPRGLPGLLNFAASWALFEWVRGWAFSGFPWNLVGSVEMLQSLALYGAFGLSLITVAIAISPALLAENSKTGSRVVMGAILSLIVLWGGGALRLSLSNVTYHEGIKLRLVQPNIPQQDKWKREFREGHFRQLLAMSADPRGNGSEPITHIIWPETAAPFFLANDPARLSQAGKIVPRYGLLITGAPSATPRDVKPFQVFNSVVAVDGQGRLTGRYDKHHLVPFGEFVPFRSLLSWSSLNIGGTDFSAGDGPATIAWKGLPPFSPQICYEIIFPGALFNPDKKPHWLLNLTNDAWFGMSTGPHQHYASARMRAVEEGLPLVRVANTGISAVVDPYGREIARLDLGKRAILDSLLPKPLETVTPYGNFHNWVFLMLALITIFTAFWCHRKTSATL